MKLLWAYEIGPNGVFQADKSMLNVENVSASYGRIVALYDVSISVEEGEVISIIGANGAGKSTLLKAIMGLVKVSSGKIEFEGNRLDRLEPHAIVSLGISYVPEGRRLFSSLNVEDNLRLGAPRKCADVKERFEEVFAVFPVLYEKRGRLAGTLSGGEQQMVAIGRALMAKPKLILMDEPSLGLSPKVFSKVLECILRINKLGVSILLSEQSAESALEISKKTYVMENGKVVRQGYSHELFSNPEIKRIYFGFRSDTDDN